MISLFFCFGIVPGLALANSGKENASRELGDDHQKPSNELAIWDEKANNDGPDESQPQFDWSALGGVGGRGDNALLTYKQIWGNTYVVKERKKAPVWTRIKHGSFGKGRYIFFAGFLLIAVLSFFPEVLGKIIDGIMAPVKNVLSVILRKATPFVMPVVDGVMSMPVVDGFISGFWATVKDRATLLKWPTSRERQGMEANWRMLLNLLSAYFFFTVMVAIAYFYMTHLRKGVSFVLGLMWSGIKMLFRYATAKRGHGEQVLHDAIIVDFPDVDWKEIAGLARVKDELRNSIMLPLRSPQLFDKKAALEPWKGILLYGPPGTGKTHLARAVASSASCYFMSISGADLMSKEAGESSKLVKFLFEHARKNAPTVVFFDELDSVCTSRSDKKSEASRGLLTQIMTEMDGLKKETGHVLVLAATNTPWALDSAILSRFQRRIHVELPDEEARLALFGIHLVGKNIQLSRNNLRKLVQMTKGYSGRDIKALVQMTGHEALHEMQAATEWVYFGGKSKLLPYKKGMKGHVIKKPFGELTEKQLLNIRLPPLEMLHFTRAAKVVRSSAQALDKKKLDKWTKEYR